MVLLSLVFFVVGSCLLVCKASTIRLGLAVLGCRAFAWLISKGAAESSWLDGVRQVLLDFVL